MKQSTINYDGVEDFCLANYCEDSYLNYALYVIKDRVLPYVGDGLKPVQRRIIYTMAIEGINTPAKKKKSAYTVGQVLGRFHPHGDSACYEAMVNMAQNFNFRYPLISGQGNFGDLFNPKGFAAMRYTEAFLSPFSESLLTELHSGNVEFIPNYNGDEKEPDYLPARLPNILLNGTTGIAVGMATDIPPHNVNEVVDACCALIDNPKLSIEQLMEYIKGPDYPCKAEIINSPEELKEIYTTGRGSIRQRATWHQEKDQIIITNVPYQSAPSLIVKIAELIQNKKVFLIEDIRDDSSETETRIILQLKSAKVNADQIMNSLFVYTDLEKTLRVNLNMIGINDKPAVKNLHTILTEWLEFRKDIVRKRYLHRLEKLLAELNRIEGLLIAHANIEEVIQIVRYNPDPKKALMERFGLNETQAFTILELKVRNLAKLEEEELLRQQQSLLQEKDQINELLSNNRKFNTQIKRELNQAKKEFGQERNSPIIYRETAKLGDITETVQEEPITIVISKHNMIRCGKGHGINLDNLSYRTGDEFNIAVEGYLNQPLYLLDSNGKAYSLDPTTLPALRGYGNPITSFLATNGANIVSMFMAAPTQKVLVATNAGVGFICEAQDFATKSRTGKILIKVKDSNSTPIQTQLFPVDADFSIPGQFQVTCVSTIGKVLTFGLDENNIQLSAGSKGLKFIKIDKANFEKGQELRNVFITSNKNGLYIENEHRNASISPADLRKTKSERGLIGRNVIKGLTPETKIFLTDGKEPILNTIFKAEKPSEDKSKEINSELEEQESSPTPPKTKTAKSKEADKTDLEQAKTKTASKSSKASKTKASKEQQAPKEEKAPKTRKTKSTK